MGLREALIDGEFYTIDERLQFTEDSRETLDIEQKMTGLLEVVGFFLPYIIAEYFGVGEIVAGLTIADGVSRMSFGHGLLAFGKVALNNVSYYQLQNFNLIDHKKFPYD